MVVKVEVWPGGWSGRAREVGRAAVANVTPFAAVAEYVAVLYDDRGMLSSTYIGGHVRSAGFWPLVARVAGSRGASPPQSRVGDEWRELADAIWDRMYEDVRPGG